jgi:hypothetical protein
MVQDMVVSGQTGAAQSLADAQGIFFVKIFNKAKQNYYIC